MNISEIALELVNHFDKSQSKTAKALKVSQPTVSGWVRGEHGMSAAVALRAEIITGGKFKAVCLCPDLNVAA